MITNLSHRDTPMVGADAEHLRLYHRCKNLFNLFVEVIITVVELVVEAADGLHL